MHIQDDYFGIPERNFIQAMQWTKGKCLHQVVTRVPTRQEVLDLPVDELRAILIGWMVYSPPELTPSGGQIAIVLEILGQREDAHCQGDLRSMCRNFIHGA